MDDLNLGLERFRGRMLGADGTRRGVLSQKEKKRPSFWNAPDNRSGSHPEASAMNFATTPVAECNNAICWIYRPNLPVYGHFESFYP